MTQTGTRGRVTAILRLEGLVVAALALWAYTQTGAGWLLFGLLVLAPDLFMLGYLRGPRMGAVLYNIGHTYVVPVSLTVAGVLVGIDLAPALGLIWVFHIGADRALGYGLKYDSGFKDTHLGR
ncbi:DUF4260 domain-containing protein [Sulfitobacter sp. D35]|uniref:DUF4260 domain-containing protein n=1 Tax=Sulfitobacter sp. D35 TaxID=3083252 RepID=UPI00296EC1E9|nr:DUF4260 domain-containing protein [Sulfitobacter sp. D35]MDW4499544.1 DUF4260 domain-containing protein [Sulfitobacter sp. D35]